MGILSRWADRKIASRDPDFLVGGRADPYLRRWWVIPRNRFFNIYLHEILRSDDDRALHDHPWVNLTIILVGGYYEVTPEGRVWRGPTRREWFSGWKLRRPTDLHRLEVDPGVRTVTLFITGPVVRMWGFACPQGWRPWEQFVKGGEKGEIGPGCD